MENFKLTTHMIHPMSRMWVAVHFLGFIWIADMQLWNSYPACELLCASLAPLELLTCSHEIPSRMWVAVCLLGSIGIADMQPWNPIQGVSCCVPPWLHWDCWHAAMKFHPACELLCASLAPLGLLTCSHEIPSRMWVAVCLLGSIGIAEMRP